VVKEVAQLFPKPMKLEFEDKVYYKFLILSKKRYVGQTLDEKGVFGKNIYDTCVETCVANHKKMLVVTVGIAQGITV
jgi:DNA polymerase elongation subunit (family B)